MLAMTEPQRKDVGAQWRWWAGKLVMAPVLAAAAAALYVVGEDTATGLCLLLAAVTVVNAITNKVTFQAGVARGHAATLYALSRDPALEDDTLTTTMAGIQPWTTDDDIRETVDRVTRP